MTAKKTTTKSEPKATKPAEPKTLKGLVCLWSETLDLRSAGQGRWHEFAGASASFEGGRRGARTPDLPGVNRML